MASKIRNLSYLVDHQLPAFINNEYPKFSAFLQKYYEYLDLPSNPNHIINNLATYRDVDSYDRESLTEETTFLSISENNGVEIEVEDASSFPNVNGYILIEGEAIFYKEKIGNRFIGCYRNINATTKLGDLYETNINTDVLYSDSGESDKTFSIGSIVKNISNLFLFALVKNFEKEYLGSFPESSLKPSVNKNLLIKNIKDFYKVKGTEKSIQFIFNSIISKSSSDVPTVYYPKDFTFKSSNGTWITKYGLKVKLLSGDISRILGARLEQYKPVSNEVQAFGIVDNFIDIGSGFYEIVLSTDSIVGEFRIASQTYLTDDLLSTETEIINVFSTLGWDNLGKLYIDGEEILFENKNINQFKTITRLSPKNHSINSLVYDDVLVTAKYEDVAGNISTFAAVPLGVVYNLDVEKNIPYLSENDKIQVTSSGNVVSDIKIIDKFTGNIRWRINESLNSPVSLNSEISQDLSRVISDVSAIFEDSEYFYITSSGYPSHNIGKSSWNIDLTDQQHLKILKKQPITSTDVTTISNQEVGILVNGVTVRSHKDEEKIVFGEIKEVIVTNQGRGYLDPPYILIEDSSGIGVASAEAVLSGEVVERVVVTNSGSGFFPPVPTVTITSGRNAIATPIVTSGKITSIRIDNPGEYYSTPPKVVIRDLSGKGRNAEYISEISDDGKLINLKKVKEGRDYNPEETIVSIESVGGGATAISSVRTWTRNAVYKYQSSLDDHNGYYFLNNKEGVGYGYSYLANPKGLRAQLQDNLDSNFITPTVLVHSPILGFAYDGYPIYGPYGYSNPLDKDSSIQRMTSSYFLKSSRPLGPSTSAYPLGYFIEDYQYSHRSGSLDENNGRYCVTPDYPEGTYAYFITINEDQSPVYPYLLGDKFYGIPVDSNYKKITQVDIPKTIRRLKTENTPENGEVIEAIVDETNTGFISNIQSVDSNNIFSPQNKIILDYGTQSYSKAISASVNEVEGKEIITIESKENKTNKIIFRNTAYLFEDSILYQENTNAFGTILGPVTNDTTVVLKNIFGTFNTTDNLYSSIPVASLLLNKSSSFEIGSIITLTNGKQAGVEKVENDRVYLAINPFLEGETIIFTKSFGGLQSDTPYYVRNPEATSFQISLTATGDIISLSNSISPGSLILSEQAKGEVLQSLLEGNTLIVKVLRGEFIVNDDYLIRSSSIFDTSNSKISTIRYLHNNIEISEINDNIAVVTTAEDHLLTEGDSVTIDINPDDEEKLTTYSVRRRVYQKVKLPSLSVIKKISDTGVGSLKILNGGGYYVYDESGNANPEGDYANGGNATYNNVELIFADQNLCREVEGKTIIGNPGNENNAKATVNITNGIVTSFVITSKGKYYKKGDILTASGSSLGRPSNSSNTRAFLGEVDHVGLHVSNTKVFLDNLESISVDDILKINDENVKVVSLNANEQSATILRGVNNTNIQNHSDSAIVSVDKSAFLLQKGYRVGYQNGSPYVNVYDSENQTLEVYFDINVPISGIDRLMPEMTFFDQSSPAKIVTVSDIIEDPSYRFEFSNDGIDWQKNPILDIQTYYKYKFNTDHFSMIGSSIEFSPSGNYNIIANNIQKSNVLPGYPGSYITIKTGYGPQIAPNNSTIKKNIEYGNYFYFDKSKLTNPEGGYLKLTPDPLQGTKILSYVTNKSFVYDLDTTPLYDGSGEMRYITTSRTAVGKIKSAKITNPGNGFSSLPTVIGVVPSFYYESIVDVNWSSVSNNIASLIVKNPGKGYRKPLAVVTNGDGKYASFNIATNTDGSIASITVSNRGTGYTFKPEVQIIESDVEMYCYSDTIGTIKSVKITNNGKSYNNDLSIQRSFVTPYFLVLKDYTGDFLEGEEVIQYDGSVETARGIVSKSGWNKGSNILKLENVSGVFSKNYNIIGNTKKSQAIVSDVFVSVLKPNIKSFYNNIGYYSSDRSKLGSLSQRLADSYFYQDYSYVIESDTSINDWRNIIHETTHPAGFVSFGELNIRSNGNASFLPDSTSFSSTRLLQLWDDETSDRRVTVQSSSLKVTETVAMTADVNRMRGKGSIVPLQYESSETISYDFYLDPPFNGYFDSNGDRIGTKTFTMKLRSSNVPLNVPNVNNLVITLDGILQEPNSSYTTSGTQITFAEAPLGYRDVFGSPITPQQYREGVDTPSQSLIGRYIGLKDSSLNTEYFRKIKNISDQFDGIQTEFDLYYEDDTPVSLDANDNLFVSIDGVLQVPGVTPLLPLKRSYYIRKTSVPNTIVFTNPPNLVEGIAQSFFAYRVGNYLPLTIDTYLIDVKKTGPFIMRSVLNQKSVFIDDDKNLLVFVDNVLQRRNRSYVVNGSGITFKEALKQDSKIDIFYLYGRDFQKFVTAFGFEDTTFFNRYTITINAVQVNLSESVGKVYNLRVDAVDNSYNILASARLKQISREGTYYIVTLESTLNKKAQLGNNLIVRDVVSADGLSVSDIFISSSNIISISDFPETDETIDIIAKDKPSGTIGTSLEPAYDDNLEVDDLIIIDGESDYRKLLSTPKTAFKTQYRNNDDVNTSYYAKLEVTSYNKKQSGEGLIVIANVDTDVDSDTYGQVTSLTWNKKEYDEYVQTTVFPRINAYGYEDYPELMFIPQPVQDEGGFITAPAQGGGAKAYAIIDNGEVLDIVLISGGSEYLTSPKVYVTYGYDVVKSNTNTTTSYFDLSVNPVIVPGFKLSHTITVIIPTLSPNIYNTSIPFVSPLSSTYQGTNFIFPEYEIAGDEFAWKETKVNVIMNLSCDMASYTNIDSIVRIHLETPLKDVQSISTLSHQQWKTSFVNTGFIDEYSLSDYSKIYDIDNLGSTFRYYDDKGIQFTEEGIDKASELTLEIVENFAPNIAVGDFSERPTSNISTLGGYWNIGRNTINEYGAILDIGINETDTVIYIPDTSRFPDSGALLIGDEVVTYTNKLSDRFYGVTRGENGTTPKIHLAGDYLRTFSEPITFYVPVLLDSTLYDFYAYYYSIDNIYVGIETKEVITRSGSFILE